jgi:hypothetical protein
MSAVDSIYSEVTVVVGYICPVLELINLNHTRREEVCVEFTGWLKSVIVTGSRNDKEE